MSDTQPPDADQAPQQPNWLLQIDQLLDDLCVECPRAEALPLPTAYDSNPMLIGLCRKQWPVDQAIRSADLDKLLKRLHKRRDAQNYRETEAVPVATFDAEDRTQRVFLQRPAEEVLQDRPETVARALKKLDEAEAHLHTSRCYEAAFGPELCAEMDSLILKMRRHAAGGGDPSGAPGGGGPSGVPSMGQGGGPHSGAAPAAARADDAYHGTSGGGTGGALMASTPRRQRFHSGQTGHSPLAPRQQAVLAAVAAQGGRAATRDIVADPRCARYPASSIRGRRADLVQQGWLCDSGQQTADGHTLWALTPAGEAVLAAATQRAAS